MRNLAAGLILILLQGLCCLSGGAASKEGITVLPSGTKLRVALTSSVDSYSAKDGEPIGARILENIEIDGKVLLPKGSQILGQIIKSDLQTSLFRRDAFALYFNRVTFPDGQIEPVPIAACVRGGVLKVIRDGQELRLDATRPVGGCCSGISIEEAARLQQRSSGENRLWRSTIFLPRRNQTIRLEQNDEMRFELLDDLRYRSIISRVSNDVHQESWIVFGTIANVGVPVSVN
jgi:hypothetical protein